MPDTKTDTTNGKTNGSKGLGGMFTAENTPNWLLFIGLLGYLGLIGPEAQKRDTDDALRFERLEAHAKLTNEKLTELNSRLEAQSAGFLTVNEFRLWQQALGHLNPEIRLPETRQR